MAGETGVVLAMAVLVANVLGAGMIVPQVLHLRRHHSTAGVSPSWVGVGIAMNLWWVSYGVSQQLWGMLPVSVVGVALYGVIASELRRCDGSGSLRLVVRGGLLIASVPLLFLIVGGWASAGVAIGSIYAIQFAPAVVAALRADDVSGIARATWTMALGEAAIWFVYGWSQRDLALGIGGGGGALMSAVILLRLAHLGRRNTAPAESPVDVEWATTPTAPVQ
ncbi:MAG: hypothetical protein R2733_00890 [Acidimicrobiales bacterium]